LLVLHGRVHDRIVRGGENVYPVEVEQALAMHPGAREAAVVGVPDRLYGEAVMAAVVAADPESPPAIDELITWARTLVAPFKVPTVVVSLRTLPRNANGKVVRRDLQTVPY